MQWYYVSDAKRRLPFEEGDVPAMVRSGVLRPETMVWNPSMDDWCSGSELHPEWFNDVGRSKEAAIGEAALVREIGGTVLSDAGWFRTAAVAGIVLAVPLLIVGVGFPLMAASIILLGAVRDIEHAAAAGQKSHLMEGVRRLRLSVKFGAVAAILAAIVLVAGALLLFFRLRAWLPI